MFDFIDISDLLHNKRVQVGLAKGIKKEHFSSFGILRNSDQNMHFDTVLGKEIPFATISLISNREQYFSMVWVPPRIRQYQFLFWALYLVAIWKSLYGRGIHPESGCRSGPASLPVETQLAQGPWWCRIWLFLAEGV